MEDTAESLKTVYIRDDDLGWKDVLLTAYLDVFVQTQTKVNLESVPARLEPNTLKLLKPYLETGFFEIHQHGASHLEYEPCNEFPEPRTEQDVEYSLVTGKAKLEKDFGIYFKPFFTPPWHNIHPKFESILRKHYLGVSPFDIPIHIDLRIRDKNGPRWKTLDELKFDYSKVKDLPSVGLLLHHYLYKDYRDLQTLKEFILFLKNEREFVFFSEL